MRNKLIIKLSILVVIFLIAIYLVFLYVNEKFTEYFGEGCMDFISFEKTPKYGVLEGKIFVSIASYRDVECSLTVKSIFEKANHPENVFLGICEQNKDSSESCDFGGKYKENIRYHNFSYKDAKGPTYARYFCSKLWRGEEYFLQIDSHTFFEKGWDTNLVEMLGKCGDKAVLSVYPPTEEQIKMKGFPVMDSGKLADSGIPMFIASFWKSDATEPIKSPKPFIAAGFFFTKGDFLYDVQYDPMLSNLFQGEECLFSARMFTNGYDCYAPNIMVCSHHYARKGPMYFKDNSNSYECRRKAEQKVKFLLGLSDKKSVADSFMRDISKYGLGKERSLEDFWKKSGVVFENGKIKKIVK